MRTRSALSSALTLVSLVALAPRAFPKVTILGSPSSYSTLQDAVDAASDGDVVLVDPGSYAGFTIDDKSLTVLALPGSPVDLTTQVAVRNLAASRRVVLSGLRVTAEDTTSDTLAGVPGLELAHDAGHVRIQDCILRGGQLFTGASASTEPAGNGVEIDGCARVVFTQCSLHGREVGSVGGGSERPGGDGLVAKSSIVALYDCALGGGIGSSGSSPAGGKGGAGARVSELGLFLSGCTVHAGDGGDGDAAPCSSSGDGGDGLVLDGAQVQALDTEILPGAEGVSACGAGAPGQTLVNVGGVFHPLAGTRRKLVGPALASDKATLHFVVRGKAGDEVWLVRAERPAFRFLLAFGGVVAVPFPWRMTTSARAVIGAGGSATIDLALGDLIGSEPGWIWYVQALCVENSGARFVSSPLALLVTNT